jgi:glycosyltransferase involved in cell wall biosynthesis
VRIAYLHYLSPNDSALTHVDEFARAARDLGTSLDVYAMNADDDAPSTAPPAVPAVPSRPFLKRHLSRYLREPRELWSNVPHLRRATRMLRDARPDVLLARVSLLTASSVILARRYRLPLVLEINAPALDATTYNTEYLHLPYIPGALERWRLEAADAATVVSSSLRSYLVERYHLLPAKLTVVPNGADVNRFRPDVAPAFLGWPNDAHGPVVGFVGSFQEFHGVDILARMIDRVARQRPGVRFLLVGDGERADTVRRTIGHLGDRVLFTGRVPHERIPALVNAFDIGVLPETAFYCCPLKVVEWMAAGRAIVAPGYGSLTDLIQDEAEGLLFPPRDEDALLAAVLRLVDDAGRRRTLGAAARRRAETSLTWRENARRVIETCRAAAERHARGSAAR